MGDRSNGVDRLKMGLAAALIALGWGLAALAFARLAHTASPDPDGGRWMAAALARAAVQTVTLVAALRWTNPALTWRQGSVLAGAWLLGAPLFTQWAAGPVRAVTLPVGFVLAALALVFVVRRAHPLVNWPRLWIILAGWGVPYVAVAWALPAERGLAGVAAGTLCGAVGGGVMFWQLGRAGWGRGGTPLLDRADLATGLRLLLERRKNVNPVALRLAGSRPLLAGAWQARAANLGKAAFTAGLVILMVVLGLRYRNALYAVAVPFVLVFLSLAVLPLAIFATSSVVVSAVAAMLASRDAPRQSFDLLRLTGLSELDIVWGYVSAPLYRLDGFLFLTVVLIPVGLGLCQCTLLLAALLTTPADAVLLAVALAAVTLGLVGMNLLGAAVGVTLGLWWRDLRAAVVAPLAMLALVLAALVCVLATFSDGARMVAAALVFMAAPYLLAVELIDDAQRWVKRIPQAV